MATQSSPNIVPVGQVNTSSFTPQQLQMFNAAKALIPNQGTPQSSGTPIQGAPNPLPGQLQQGYLPQQSAALQGTQAPSYTPPQSSGGGMGSAPNNSYNGATPEEAALLKAGGVSTIQWNYNTQTDNAANNSETLARLRANPPVAPVDAGSTGNTNLDAILKAAFDHINSLVSGGYTVPAGLQVTPDLIQHFLDVLHAAPNGDAFTKQLIDSELPNINASIANITTKYGNDMGQMIQDFGTGLASEQNTAGANGMEFSGLRNLTESNLAAGVNRQLSTLGSQAATDVGNQARLGAARVGSANAGGINLPSIAGGQVSLAGGSRGSSFSTNPFNLNYNPSTYTLGSIPAAQEAAIKANQNTALNTYSTLAANQTNSGRSINDLLGMMNFPAYGGGNNVSSVSTPPTLNTNLT